MEFSTWWIAALLVDSGWPRKKGVLRKRDVVDVRAVDGALTQLGQFGVVMGADAPEVALRLMTASFDQDWDEQSVAELVNGFLEKMLKKSCGSGQITIKRFYKKTRHQ